jgi:hypothetical protein
MTLAKTRTWIAQATSSKRQGAEMAKRGLLWAKSGHFAAAVLSALGQKQTFAAQNGMSALPPKADIGATFVFSVYSITPAAGPPWENRYAPLARSTDSIDTRDQGAVRWRKAV